ncbi:MAG: HlyD family secretion protein [Rhodothalassiaceae bacterium]
MSLFRKEVFEARRKRLWGEVILIQPLSYAVLTALLGTVVLGAAAALAVGSFARTEQARGYLTPSLGQAQVQALRAGTIEAVLVDEGDRVEAGQPLIRVRAEQLDAAGLGVEARQIQLLRDRLAAMDDRIAHARSMAQENDRQLTTEITGIETELAETQARLQVQARITASAEESFNGLDELVEKGFVAKAEYERRRQTFLSQQAQETRIRQQLATLETRLDRARQDRALLPRAAEESVRELQGLRDDLQSRLVQLEGQHAYTLTAPIAWRIAALQAAPGRLADPARPLATILPEGAVLEAELLVPSAAIGFVAPGQPVRLVYDAFPYQRFGTHEAEVIKVTRTVLAPQDVTGPLQVQEPVYRVTVAPRAQAILAYGQEVPLQAGMTLSANIVLERRTLLDWLLEPLRAVRART